MESKNWLEKSQASKRRKENNMAKAKAFGVSFGLRQQQGLAVQGQGTYGRGSWLLLTEM